MTEQATLGDYARSQVKRRCPNKSMGRQCELKAEHRGYHEALAAAGYQCRAYWSPHEREPLHPEYCRCAKWCAPRERWMAEWLRREAR